MAKKSGLYRGFIETTKTIIYALLIAGVFRTFIFQPFWIPSGSMKETLLIGDFLFVNKMVYGYSFASCPSIRIGSLGIDISSADMCRIFKGNNARFWAGSPERGDVVVFSHPVTATDFIKRIVGMPGDTVQMVNGVLIINGEAVSLQDAGTHTEIADFQGNRGVMPRCSNGIIGQGGTCEKQRQLETLPNGRSHTVLNIRDQSSDNTQEYEVPEGHYFVVGDNRDNSSDSRFSTGVGGVGFVPYENLVGRADRIFFSSAGNSLFFFWTWRSDRFFKSIE